MTGKMAMQIACNILVSVLKARAPYDTGNMAVNSIRSDGECVYIGGEIAPYAVFTDAKWIDKKWNGKQNPNEGWVRASIMEATPMIKSALDGRMTMQEAGQTVEKYQAILIRRQEQYEEYFNKLSKEKQDKIIKLQQKMKRMGA